MTPKEKRRAAALRKRQERMRKREAGLVPVEVWVPVEAVCDLRNYVQQLGEKK